jgi:tRNA-dihydrouridine synthase B
LLIKLQAINYVHYVYFVHYSKMKIKDLEIKGKTFLAPLAGITNLPFRLLVKQIASSPIACSVVCTEMVSAKGFYYNPKKTMPLLATKPEEQPLSVQIFGAEPKVMADCAKAITDMKIAGLIDINFGCSVRKIIKQGAGAALMRSPDLAADILSSVRKATDLPLTIKMRTGWDASGQDAFRLARIAEDTGVNALSLHPRTATQGFKGKANWDIIRDLKNKVSIPVIGNGDILCVEDADKMLTTTGCDAVMVGRAALSNPFLFSQIEDFINTGAYTQPSPKDMFSAMSRLVHGYTEHFGEERASKMLRGRLAWFVKGMPGCSAFRKKLSSINSTEQALRLIKELEEFYIYHKV